MTRTFTLDFPNYSRSTVGFDKLFNELERSFANTGNNYPPYNVVQLNENEWQITVAVAGFKMDELEIVLDKNTLTIDGKPTKADDTETVYLHKGIGSRSFKRTFTLADHIEVASATLELGMLNIHLVRNVPEALQPKKIAINATKTIEA